MWNRLFLVFVSFFRVKQQDEALMKPAEQGALRLHESLRNVSAHAFKHGSAAPKISKTEPPN